MPYIGNTSPSRFVSNRAASVYSGDGSTTAFTLEQAVVQDEDILVSVDGVVQEPSVAYAVSNGTTLTFTAAPSSNAGNNIFVYYLASQVGTVGHPADQNLSAGTGTFTGDLTVDTSTLKVDSTNNRIGVGVASPSSSLHIRTADSSATAQSGSALVIEGTDATRADLQFLGDAGAFQAIYFGDNSDADIGRIAYDHTGNSMRFTVNAAECMRIDSTGVITKPLQPAFNAKGSSTPTLAINTYYTLPVDTEIFDQNADYNASNYTFTAPITGRYQLNGSVYMYNSLDSSAGYMILIIKTSNREYQKIITATMFGSDIANYSMNISTLADMDANDTAYLQLYQQAGAAQVTISGGNTHFTGFLAC